MVERVLTTCYGMKLQGETCAKITILPGMMRRFNQNMYDHEQLRENAGPHAASQGGHVGEEEDCDCYNLTGRGGHFWRTPPSACKY